MAHLTVKKGLEPGRVIPLSRVMCIGRGLDMDVRLDSLTVSKRHARILRNERGDYILEDLASSNGTFLNGRQVTTKELSEGDKITVGEAIFEFHRPEGESSKVTGEHRLTDTVLDIGKNDPSSLVRTSVDANFRPTEELVTGETTVEHLARVNYRLTMLLDIAQSLGGALEEDELLEKILDKLFEVFPETNRGFIILRDPETGQLEARKRRIKKSSAPEEERLQISETILEYVLEHQQGVLIEDTHQDDRLPTSQSILDFEMRSVMCVPLMSGDQVLGFVQLDTDRIAANYDNDGLRLLVGIANQAALTIANARLHSQLVDRERLERDLQIARRIQNSFLPKEPPQVPGYEFEDAYATALEVGGDFFDFIALPDNELVIVVGDVSGKGIPAALMMAKMASDVRFLATLCDGPGVLLKRLNALALGSETDMFVTVLIIWLNHKDHTMRMSNAGHCYPLMRKATGEVVRLEGGGGFPVGIMNDAEFEEDGPIPLQEGEVICVFTDGIVEAMDAQKEQFGYQRLSERMAQAQPSAGDVVHSVQQAIRDHASGVAQSDDLTLVCFSRLSSAAQ